MTGIDEEAARTVSVSVPTKLFAESVTVIVRTPVVTKTTFSK
jgi:hypothetical protein